MSMLNIDLDRIRETIVVGTIALFLGIAVYTLLGLAWSFKMTVEGASKIRHSFDRPV